MTNAIAGYNAKLMTSTSTGGSVTALAELRDYTLSVEHAEIDATSHDSSGDREIIAGVGSWSGSADLLHVMSNATHKAAFDLLTSRTKVDAEFYPTGSSSDGHFSGEMFFTSFELSAPNEDALAVGLSFMGTGALARNSSST